MFRKKRAAGRAQEPAGADHTGAGQADVEQPGEAGRGAGADAPRSQLSQPVPALTDELWLHELHGSGDEPTEMFPVRGYPSDETAGDEGAKDPLEWPEIASGFADPAFAEGYDPRKDPRHHHFRRHGDRNAAEGAAAAAVAAAAGAATVHSGDAPASDGVGGEGPGDTGDAPRAGDDRTADGAGKTPDGDDGHHFFTAKNTRRGLLLVAIGAVAAAAASMLVYGGPSGRSPQLNVAGDTENTAFVEGAVFQNANTGDCLSWTQGTQLDLSKVDCAKPHLFEVAANLDLSTFPGKEFGPQAKQPTPIRYTQLRDEMCAPAVSRYLDGRFDPHGKFTIGLIHPSDKGWSNGERLIHCGLQNTSSDGVTYYPITGKVADQDQSRVWPTGTCLGIKGNVPTDPVACVQTHAVEVTYTADLGTKFTGDLPPVAEQDKFLEGVCNQQSSAYLGSPDALRAKSLTVFWDNIDLASWLAGSRKVNCTIGAPDPAGGFSAISGSAKGDIVVNGKAPAPPPQAPPGRVLPTPVPIDPSVPGQQGSAAQPGG